jgi:hypothetical protein
VFREANKITRQFTRPVVISTKTVDGTCSAGIGTCVVLNDEGWIVTAHHLVAEWKNLTAATAEVAKVKSDRNAIENDAALSGTKKHKALNALRLNPKAPENCSLWIGIDHVQNVQIKDNLFLSIEPLDIAVARIADFNPGWVKAYPTIKDPSKDYEPGQSLCTLGFPLHQVTPSWNQAAQAFTLPPEALPLPFFPIEGILTRFVQGVLPGNVALPIPVKWIETSHPGLRGQSGGPIFDPKGTLWGIQVKTTSYPLGFNTGNHTQYLNVGLGAHTEALIALFNEVGIKFQLSAY